MTTFSYYLIVVLLLSTISIFAAKFAKETNEIQGTQSIEQKHSFPFKSAYKIFITGLLFNAVWVFCSILSTNLMFDSMLYDALVTIFYTAALIFMGVAISLSAINYVGVAFIILGLTLMRL